mmetsp:Transcript_25933/g.59282  ORF Transcript_25933/g.59282 Transcript_25933/m.59282 type:complete len:224 (-) Transcript_25933:68-739(-)
MLSDPDFGSIKKRDEALDDCLIEETQRNGIAHCPLYESSSLAFRASGGTLSTHVRSQAARCIPMFCFTSHGAGEGIAQKACTCAPSVLSTSHPWLTPPKQASDRQKSLLSPTWKVWPSGQMHFPLHKPDFWGSLRTKFRSTGCGGGAGGNGRIAGILGVAGAMVCDGTDDEDRGGGAKGGGAVGNRAGGISGVRAIAGSGGGGFPGVRAMAESGGACPCSGTF